MKIIDILNHCSQNGTHCLSFEYYPPKDLSKWPEFYQKVTRMGQLNPNFIDVTWGTGDPTSLATLEVSDNIQNQTGIDTMMHFTCTHRSRHELMDILEHVSTQTKIRNIMALRGNKLPNAPWTPHPEGFTCAAQLVESMRSKFGDLFSISVAGYPEGHKEDGLPPSPEFTATQAYRDQIHYLKQKVDAGADFIVTQLCFDLEQLCRYRDLCAQTGISCPIIPGLLPIYSHQTWNKIAAFSASLPPALSKQYEMIPKEDPNALEDFAIQLLHRQIDFLHTHGFYAVHIYTLNHEKLISKALADYK
ncbi:MAG: methylenetetrahydrofolate reductase [Proteobacteria bacterium]|nr:methylenetetrahydrofolate reductase [Pseudomonadota bacterium]